MYRVCRYRSYSLFARTTSVLLRYYHSIVETHHKCVQNSDTNLKTTPHGINHSHKSSLALNLYSPAMNGASPPNKPTNGKNIVGLSRVPHQLAMYDYVIHIEPARPSAAGGAMGFTNIWIPGVFEVSCRAFRIPEGHLKPSCVTKVGLSSLRRKD